MDTANMALVAEMGANLTSLAVKGTVTAVTTKIKSIKMERDIEVIKNRYDEILNELLSEREQAVRIAQQYRNELERYQISNEDIDHLHATVGKVLEILKAMSPDTPVKGYEQIRELISVDTLKTMQLLGFNYKAAIGEPLTQACATAIQAKLTGPQNNNAKNRKADPSHIKTKL